MKAFYDSKLIFDEPFCFHINILFIICISSDIVVPKVTTKKEEPMDEDDDDDEEDDDVFYDSDNDADSTSENLSDSVM